MWVLALLIPDRGPEFRSSFTKTWATLARIRRLFFYAGPLKGRASHAAEKPGIRAKWAKHNTSGAKAHVDYITFTPGINPRPTLKPSGSKAAEKAGKRQENRSLRG
jgi:hypothetical protein